MRERLLGDMWVPVEGEKFASGVAQNECVEVAGYQNRPSAARRRIWITRDPVELAHAESKLRQPPGQRDDLATSEDQ